MGLVKTIEQALKEWDTENSLGDPRFYFKHAVRLQGLYLQKDGRITDTKGKLYGILNDVYWKDDITIEAKIKLSQAIDFIPISIDIGKLR